MDTDSKSSAPKSHLNLGLVENKNGVFSKSPKVISVVSSVLERIIQKNERTSRASFVGKDVITIFHGTRPPGVSIKQYIERIFKYANCSPSCIVVAYIYLDRFFQQHQTHVRLTSLNVHRLLITAILLAAKFMEDEVKRMDTDNKSSAPKSYLNLGLVKNKNGVFSKSPKVIPVVSLVLERTIQKNERTLRASSVGKDVIAIFHGTRAPGLSIMQYIERIFKYSNCSPSCIVVAYIYLDRFLQRHQTHVRLTSLNVHRLLITTIMLATKFMEDECYNNAYYAKVGGVSTAEINKLEMKFLFSIDFRLHVTVDTFQSYCSLLEDEEAERRTPWRQKFNYVE